MQRILAAIFLVMANLVFAVVPHHHHDNDLCFDTVIAEQNHNATSCNDACSSENGQKDSDEKSDSCMLSHIVALYNGEIKQNIRACIISHDLIKSTSLYALEGNENLRFSNPKLLNQLVFSDRIPVYHSIASKVFGLRAPPFSC